MNKAYINSRDLFSNQQDERLYLDGQLFTGFVKSKGEGKTGISQIKDGYLWGIWRIYDKNEKLIEIDSFCELKHGYSMKYYIGAEYYSVFLGGELVEALIIGKNRTLKRYIAAPDITVDNLIEYVKDLPVGSRTMNDMDFSDYYRLQDSLSTQVITTDQLPAVRYVAGADVAYNELEQRMVGAIVVLDAHTLDVVDQAIHEMDITFPYVPGLFSFREVPALVAAYRKLNIQPDLIVCDGHGIAHPKGLGMASHLGLELDVPTIGCAKSRLIGEFDPVGPERGAFSLLLLGTEEIGCVLRTQENIRPIFVSVGHKISIETARRWVLQLCPEFRLPETTRRADALVRTVMKTRTDIGYPEP